MMIIMINYIIIIISYVYSVFALLFLLLVFTMTYYDYNS